jgi:hypothetical protein
MSTKTTFKRIALVAVASLSFGVLTSVAPANALADETAALTVFATSPTTATAVNGTATIAVSVGASVALTAAAGFTVIPANTNRPFGSAAPTVSLTSASAAAPFATAGAVADTSVLTTSGAGLQSTAQGTSGGTLGTITAGVGTRIGTLTVTGFDAPGVYTVTITPNGAGVDTAVVVSIPVGLSLDPIRANRAFAVQGTNTTSAWSGVDTGLVTARITGFSTTSTVTYYVTAQNAVINSYTERDSTTDTSLTAFTPTNAVNLADGFNFLSTGAATSAASAVDVQLNPTDGATTASITVTSFNATTGVSSTHVVATVALGAAPAASAQYSTSIIAAAADAAIATDALSVSLARTVGGLAANITVTVRDQNNNIVPGTVSASITGPGLLSITKENTRQTADVGTGRSVALSVGDTALNTDGIQNISVYADGTAGVATITITAGTTTLATETVTFFGTVATLEVTQNLKVARASATGAELGTSVGTGLAADG